MSQFYLVAPSGYCINQQAAARGVERLQQAGHEVAHQQVIPRRQQRFAGTEHERLADINQLAQLPGRNRIVLAVRGGYGASRLLPHIDWQGLVARQQRDPLLICGHSDFTAIQSGLAGHGQRHHLQRANARRQLRRGDPRPVYRAPFLAGATPAGIHPRMAGRRAELPGGRHPVGGNLAMLTSLIGTPWLPAIRDGILVVEDINEHPFRVERMLLQLLHSGVLAAQKAVIFGSFTGSAPNDYDAGYDLPQVFDYLRQQLSLPLISGLEFGHEQRTVTLPLGARARLVNQAAATTLTIGGHPVLTE